MLSCWFFDVIVNYCVFVIISDKIELLFEDDFNYSEFFLFFLFKEVIKLDFLVSILRNFLRERWLLMWYKLRVVFYYFEY